MSDLDPTMGWHPQRVELTDQEDSPTPYVDEFPGKNFDSIGSYLVALQAKRVQQGDSLV
jgi:hypothetical protein